MKLGSTLDFLGHATTMLELGGLRVLTDPVLRRHLAFLERQVDVVPPARYAGADIVVISHLHWDHLDLPSIRQLIGDPIMVVPKGAGELLRRNGSTTVVEMVPGDTATFGGVRVTATKAVHRGFRPPFGPDAPSLGFVLEDPDRRIYFAGDTDIFPEMAELGDLDLALLPIWGWGPRLGPGHMDPYRAAEALKLLRPKVAVPIHWGTYWLRGGGRLAPSRLVHPPREFAAYAAISAPNVRVAAALPGEQFERLR